MYVQLHEIILVMVGSAWSRLSSVIRLGFVFLRKPLVKGRSFVEEINYDFLSPHSRRLTHVGHSCSHTRLSSSGLVNCVTSGGERMCHIQLPWEAVVFG